MEFPWITLIDLNILVHDPAVAPELVLRGGGGGQRRAEKPTHILSISKGKFDSSYRTKEGEIEVKENQRKSDSDSRGSISSKEYNLTF